MSHYHHARANKKVCLTYLFDFLISTEAFNINDKEVLKTISRVRSQKLKVKNQKSKIKNQISKIKNQKSKIKFSDG